LLNFGDEEFAVAGIFVWMVKATDIKGKLIKKKGTTMLIR